MITILKHGNVIGSQKECNECGCQFVCFETDIRRTFRLDGLWVANVRCPDCGNHVRTPEWDLKEPESNE